MSWKKRRTYSEDFKKQMVPLYESGKSPSELVEEYDLSPASIYQWRSSMAVIQTTLIMGRKSK